MILPILTYPNVILRTKSVSVEYVGFEVIKLVANMADTMYSTNGIGLSAIQIGEPLRIIVADLRQSKEKDLLVFINPQIVEHYGNICFEEGCLSVPDTFVNVDRCKLIVVKALDINGKQFIIKAEDLLAVVIQHEIDHLLGNLIIDYENSRPNA